MNRTSSLKFAVVGLIILLIAGLALAQTGTGTLRGRVSDPSDAVIPQATVTVKTAAGQTLTATTKGDGTYEVKNVPVGKVSLEIVAKGFSPAAMADIEVAAGQVKTVDVPLAIEVAKEVVQVEDEATRVDVDPAQNASAIVLKGKDLDALSDDPDELQEDLLALAGPSAGPNGGQIYIDGFSNGQLPPKSAIREIRINQNPFSAEFDHIGFGRIEVFTKPGQDKFRGSFMTNLNNSVFNSRNPFNQGANPNYYSRQFNGNFSGPIGKKASFFFNLERRNVNDSAIINAVVLDDNFVPVDYSTAVLHPITRTSLGPRFDYQVSKSNTLTARYRFTDMRSSNNGIGQYSLESLASSRNNTEQEIQLSDTQVISNYTINETRFEYERQRSEQNPLNFDPTISVGEAFTSGGNSGGTSVDHDDNIELQNYTMQTRGRHIMKWGGRLRWERAASFSNGGFNGTFSFANIGAYQRVQQGLHDGQTMAQIRDACIGQQIQNGTNPDGSPIYRSATILDCAPGQYLVTFGGQNTLISQTDVGVYFADDWRARPNLTVSYGLRAESQNNIGVHLDVAPRVAIAWGIGRGKGTPKTVLRAGAGMFYDRFDMGTVLNVRTLNGTFQQQFKVQTSGPNADPAALDFYANLPALPTAAELGVAQSPSIYTLTPNLRTPYMIQAAVSLERQLAKKATVAVNYVASRGLHQTATLYNADTGSGLRDYLYADSGVFKQQQLMIVPNIQISSTISLHSFYTLSWANSTPGTPSIPGTPSNPAANLMIDYGRSPFDVRQRFMIMGSISLPYGFRINPNIMASSGRPFTIVTGYDDNGDTYYNERPSVANPTRYANDATYRADVVDTTWGLFNLHPSKWGESVIPINSMTGPAQVTVGMRISKTFALGRRREIASAGQPGGDRPFMGGDHGPGGGGPGGGHGPGGGGGGGGFRGGAMMMGGGGRGGPGGASGGRYSLTISADARNLLNRVNLGNPVSNLSSGRVGEYTNIVGGFGPGGGSSANRRISFQAMFNF